MKTVPCPLMMRRLDPVMYPVEAAGAAIDGGDVVPGARCEVVVHDDTVVIFGFECAFDVAGPASVYSVEADDIVSA